MLFNKLALPAFIAVTAGYAAACPYLKGANSASSDCDTEAQVQRALQSSFRYGRFFDVETVPPSGTLVHEYIEQASPGEGSYMDEAARSSRGSLILDNGELFTEYRLRGIESSVSFEFLCRVCVRGCRAISCIISIKAHDSIVRLSNL